MYQANNNFMMRRIHRPAGKNGEPRTPAICPFLQDDQKAPLIQHAPLQYIYLHALLRPHKIE